MWTGRFSFSSFVLSECVRNERALLLAFCRSIQQFVIVIPFYQPYSHANHWIEWNGKWWHPVLSLEDVKLTQIYSQKLFPSSCLLYGKPAVCARTRPHDVTSTKSFGRTRFSCVFCRRLNQSSADFHQCWWSFATIRPKRKKEKKITIQLYREVNVDKLKASVSIDLFALGKLITQSHCAF